jgi:hypothetical protein
MLPSGLKHSAAPEGYPALLLLRSDICLFGSMIEKLESSLHYLSDRSPPYCTIIIQRLSCFLPVPVFSDRAQSVFRVRSLRVFSAQA